MIQTFFGKRGSGKTTAIRALIPDLPEPVVIVDVLGNFDPDVKPNNPNWVAADGVDATLAEIENYFKDPKTHPGVIVARDGDISRLTDFVSSALWHARGGTLVLDEVDSISLAEAPCFDEAIRYGRNRGIEIVTGCRRPAEISRNITAGADRFYCFRTHEPRDIEYFSKLFGDEKAQKLSTLPKYQGVYIDHAEDVEGEFRTDRHGEIEILTRREAL